MVRKKSVKKTRKFKRLETKGVSKKLKGRDPSNKSKNSKVKKLIKLAKSKKRK